MGGEAKILQYFTCEKNLCTYKRNRRRYRKDAEAEAIRQQAQRATVNSSTTPSARAGANTITPPTDAPDSSNVIIVTSTRTRAAYHAAFNSTMYSVNVTQRENVVNGSDL